MNKFPLHSIGIMLHALGIAYLNNGRYTQPNTRYSPYPVSWRNQYQDIDNPTWDRLIHKGYASRSLTKYGEHFYYVTSEGKAFLRKKGYKWHDEYKNKGEFSV